MSPQEALQNLQKIAEPGHQHSNGSGWIATESLKVLARMIEQAEQQAQPSDAESAD